MVSNPTIQSGKTMIPKLPIFFAMLTLTLSAVFPQNGQAESPDDSVQPMLIGQKMPSFSLKDFLGKEWKSTDFDSKKQLVVLFFGTECPLVQLYAPKLIEIQERFGNQGLQIVGIDSNQQDSLTEIKHFARKSKIEFPLLKDVGNKIADQFGAQRTPEIFVFDVQRKLRYRGQIDDQYSYGLQRPKVDNEYLVNAIEKLNSGEKPAVTMTKPVGCHIGRILDKKGDETVTYANQISRIFQNRCVSCHRSGEIAPFELTDYDEVVGWAEMIREVVNDQRMPPWHASKKHGDFKNDASLSELELKQINHWVDNGAPKGDEADLPEPKQFAQGWQIGEPDDVFPITKRPYRVPATGVVEYEHFVVDPGFKEDKWIKAAECRIGNRAVVHHIIVAIKGRDRKKIHGEIDSEWITATAPGAPPLVLPDGYAKLIPAGSKLVFQMHYTPNGTEQTDLSHVGFVYADPEKVKKTVGTREIINDRIKIRPGGANQEFTAWHRFKEDSLMLTLFPHMHLRGKAFRYTAHYPNDGGEEILLDIPNYDFNWQNNYQFREPKLMPRGTKIECTAIYDNSEKNLANPRPDLWVGWGDQTTDEMMIGYFDMVLVDQDLTSDGQSPRTARFLKTLEKAPGIVEDKKLKKMASVALNSKKEMRQFGIGLREAFPQIDRVCWTTVSESSLEIQRAAQVPEFAKHIEGEGAKRSIDDCRIPHIASGETPIAINNLEKQKETDLLYMSSMAKSSFHIPVHYDGKNGTINFWSAENEAFPKQAQTALVKIVAQLND